MQVDGSSADRAWRSIISVVSIAMKTGGPDNTCAGEMGICYRVITRLSDLRR